MSAQCLSSAGPPPGCGFKPTPERPVCPICQSSYDRNLERTEKKLIEDAITVLQSRGYSIIPPN